MIAILLLLAMGITASSVGLNSTIQALTDDQAPFDLTVQNRSADESGPVDFDAAIKAGEPKAPWPGAMTACSIITTPPSPAWSRPAGPSPSATITPCWSTWAAPPTPAPAPSPRLGGGRPRHRRPGGCSASWWRTRSPSGWRSAASCGRADYAGDKQASEDTVLPLVSDAMQGLDGPDVRIDSRLALYQETMGSKILVLFLGLYLGFTFLLAAAAVLALQQLSQGADNAGAMPCWAAWGWRRRPWPLRRPPGHPGLSPAPGPGPCPRPPWACLR